VRAAAQKKFKARRMARRIIDEVTELAPVSPRVDRSELVNKILREADVRSRVGTQADTIRSISNERIIGRSDLRDLSYLELGIAVARGVVRLPVPGGAGSGCLVGPRILLTNHHVLQSPDVAGFAQFDVQDDASGQQMPRHDYKLMPSLFFFTLKELDITLVGLAERSNLGQSIDTYPWMQLQAADRELEDRDAITIIQHPLGGLKQIALRNNEVILVVSEPPRFVHYTTDTQPGASGAPCFDDQWRLVALHHSGVPDTDKEGNILKRDGQRYRKGHDRPDTIKWIANEGVRMSAIIDALKHARMTGDQARLRDEMLATQPPNPVILARDASASGSAPPSSQAPPGLGRPSNGPPRPGGPSPDDLPSRPQPGGPTSETSRPDDGSRDDLPSRPQPGGRGSEVMYQQGVPLVVNISANQIRSVRIDRGDTVERLVPSKLPTMPITTQPGLRPPPQGDRSPAIASVGDVEDEDESEGEVEDEATRIDPNWKNRSGYDPMFLGEKVLLPRLSRDQRKQSAVVPPQYLRAGADPYVFDYHHFSLTFNKKRRFAWYSAANVDGDRRAHKYKRGRDKWFYDPRMDDPSNPTLQMGEELYAGRDTDRGHLTRYLDVQWGDSLAETVNATNDTFHFSNCALQLAAFNQGKERWQGIEQFLLEKKARPEKRRMIVFTGPVFRMTDPIYRNERMDDSIRIPMSFWKVCVLAPRDERKLSATAFQLGQPDITDLPGFEERFDVTATQITIAKLEQIAALDFGRLKSFDHYAKTGEGALEVDRTGVLEMLDDILI
jgi:endonuclease G